MRPHHYDCRLTTVLIFRSETRLIQLIQLQLAFGDLPLLDGASLSVQRGDSVGLIGRNGSGKSSLLKLIAGSLQADDGLIQREDGVRCVVVEQEPSLPDQASLF